MKLFKKILAATLAVLTVFSLAACHPKDEVAVTIGDYEFTSAYYMCAFIFADMEAQQKAYDLVMSGEVKDIDVTEEDYLYDVKIDGKEYETWVKDKAIDTLKTIAAYKTLCDKAGVKISAGDKAGAEELAKQEWNQYYKETLYNNGVHESTYIKYRVDDYYSELYFDHLYTKGGEKEVSAEEIKKHLNENYVLCNVIGEDLSQLEDAQKTEKKNKINDLYKELTSGKSFTEVYKAYKNITDDKKTETTDSKEPKPKDEYASFVSKENGGDHFDSIKAMQTGEIKILNGKDDSDILLVVKKDVNEDPYYLEEYDLQFRHELKDEEFADIVAKCKKGLKIDIDSYATDRFDVEDIVYPAAE